MEETPEIFEVESLFLNGDPEAVWQKVTFIISHLRAGFDFRLARTAFEDVVGLFAGRYPGYCPIKTRYHDLRHTLDVLMCAVRLMHGVHLSGVRLTDDDITMVMMAALMHDVGYAQHESEAAGTGAQYTKTHVSRSVDFMQRYLVDHHFPDAFSAPLTAIIRCSNPVLNISDIQFPDEHICLLGKILGTADLTGQMADRTYLEKLLFLYLEFEEASFSGFQNIHDLLRKTQTFYVETRRRLLDQFGGIGVLLALHFKEMHGVERNFYLESIEKNIAYLARITTLDDEKHLSMLKRGGIVEKNEPLVASVPDRAKSPAAGEPDDA